MSISHSELKNSIRKNLIRLSKAGFRYKTHQFKSDDFYDLVALMEQYHEKYQSELALKETFEPYMFLDVTLNDEENSDDCSIRDCLPLIFEAICHMRSIYHIDNSGFAMTKSEHFSLISILERSNSIDALTLCFKDLSEEDCADVLEGYLNLFKKVPGIKHVTFTRLETKADKHQHLIRIYDFLKTNTSIQTVSFKINGLNQEIPSLASMMGENKTLREIHIKNLGLGAEDKKTLVAAYEKNRYLRRLTIVDDNSEDKEFKRIQELNERDNIPDVLNNFALFAANTAYGRTLPNVLWLKIASEYLPEFFKNGQVDHNKANENLKKHQNNAVLRENPAKSINCQIAHSRKPKTYEQATKNSQIKERTEDAQAKIDLLITSANVSIKRLNHWWWFNGRAKSKEIANAIAFIREKSKDPSLSAEQLFNQTIDSNAEDGSYKAGVSLRDALNKHRYTFLDPLRNKDSLKPRFKKHETTRTLNDVYTVLPSLKPSN